MIELNERDDGAAIQAELLAMTGQRTVPSVWIDGSHLGGCDGIVASQILVVLTQFLSRVDTMQALPELEQKFSPK